MDKRLKALKDVQAIITEYLMYLQDDTKSDATKDKIAHLTVGRIQGIVAEFSDVKEEEKKKC